MSPLRIKPGFVGARAEHQRRLCRFSAPLLLRTHILIWAASTLNELRKKGVNDLPRTLSFHPYDLLRPICRDTGGREYRLLRESLARLQATTIVTNIRVKRGKKQRQFSWIESWTDLQDETTGQSQGMSLTLSEWFYEGILMDGSLLAIDPVYFSITGGRERWLYRVARKHAGGAGCEGFAIPLPTLFEKSGAEGTYRRFKFELQAIIHRNDLPGFSLSLEGGRGEPVLRMNRREGSHALLPPSRPRGPAKSGKGGGQKEAGSLSLFAGREVSLEAMAHLCREFPDLDIQALKVEFDAWLDRKPERAPQDYDAAFYGFVRRFNARAVTRP